jgi:chromosome segregation ATPase
MFFVAGLLVAGLAALLILPAFARRALRLSETRARMSAPLSMKEVVAERDLLRAEHALEQHRLERRLAGLQDAGARHRADLGRQAANIVALESRTDKMTDEIAGLRGELAASGRNVSGLEADLGASQIALNDFAARLERAASELASLREQQMTLETAADDQRTVIAGLETRATGLEMKYGDSLQTAKSKAAAAQTEIARLSSELAYRASEIVRLNATIAEALAKGAIVVADLEKKNAELERTRQRLSEIEAGGQSDLALREAISRLAADVARLSGATADISTSEQKSDKPKRRESRAPSSQGPDSVAGVASAKLRQLQPTAPQR